MKYCVKCGAELFDEAVICVKCGCAVGGTTVAPEPAALQPRAVASPEVKQAVVQGKKKNAASTASAVFGFFFTIFAALSAMFAVLACGYGYVQQGLYRPYFYTDGAFSFFSLLSAALALAVSALDLAFVVIDREKAGSEKCACLFAALGKTVCTLALLGCSIGLLNA